MYQVGNQVLDLLLNPVQNPPLSHLPYPVVSRVWTHHRYPPPLQLHSRVVTLRHNQVTNPPLSRLVNHLLTLRVYPLLSPVVYRVANRRHSRLDFLAASLQVSLVAFPFRFRVASHRAYPPEGPVAIPVANPVASRAASLQTSLVENRLLPPHHIRRFCSRWHFSRRVVVITPHLYCGRWIAWVMLAMTPLCF